MQKSGHMVLKGVNWVHNTNVGVTFLGQVVFHFREIHRFQCLMLSS